MAKAEEKLVEAPEGYGVVRAWLWNWWEGLGDKDRPKLVRTPAAILYGAVLLVALAWGQTYLHHAAYDMSAGLVETLAATDEVVPIAGTLTDEPAAQRLSAQLDTTRQRKGIHLELARFFYSRQFMAITLASISGILAAVMLVVVTKGGWNKANVFIAVTFFVAAGGGLFYGSFPGMFKQADNIEQNVTLHVAYSNLEGELLSYMATGGLCGESKEASAVVHYVDARLAELNAIPVGFDATKIITSGDALRELQEITE